MQVLCSLGCAVLVIRPGDRVLPLAGLVAINLSVVFWQWSGPKRTAASQFFRLMCCACGSLVAFFLLNLMFLWYLLAQWLVD
jgi:hypothetical protein